MTFLPQTWIARVLCCVGLLAPGADSSPADTTTVSAATDLVEAARITEVRVFSGQDPGGLGWTVTRRQQMRELCYVITPFHVVGNRFTGKRADDISVIGAGVPDAIAATFVTRYRDRDLALLTLQHDGPCPFDEGPSARQYVKGTWLVRLGETQALDELRVDTVTDIAPLSEQAEAAQVSLPESSKAALKQGWSGATVFRNGARIGMVFGTNGNAANFYTARAIQVAFGDKVTIFQGRDYQPCKAGRCKKEIPIPYPPIESLFGTRLRIVYHDDNVRSANRLAAELEQRGAFVSLERRLRQQLPKTPELHYSSSLATNVVTEMKGLLETTLDTRSASTLRTSRFEATRVDAEIVFAASSTVRD